MTESTLLDAVRANWLSWLPQWSVIAIWVFIGTARSTFQWDLPEGYYSTLMVMFIFGGFWASKPYLRKRVSLWQQFFWVVLVPVVSAVAFSVLWHGVAGDIGA